MTAKFYSNNDYESVNYSQINKTLNHINSYSILSRITIRIEEFPVNVELSKIDTTPINLFVTEVVVHCVDTTVIDSHIDRIFADFKVYLTHLIAFSNKNSGVEHTLALLEEIQIFCQDQISFYNLDRKIRFKVNLRILITDGKREEVPSKKLFLSLLSNDDHALIREAMDFRKELWEEMLLEVRKSINSVRISFHRLSSLESFIDIPNPILVQIIQLFWESDYITSLADFEKFEKHILTLLGKDKKKYDKSKSEYKGRRRDKLKGLRELIDQLSLKLNSPKKTTEN